MLVIGLTGGIGMGKSTVARHFQSLGVPIIDTDKIAKILVKPNSKTLSEIKTHFSAYIILPDGSLDRKALAKIIFASKKEKKWLEQLLHPLIRDEVIKQLAKLDSTYCIVEIPLLNNKKEHPYLHRILSVSANKKQQIHRVSKRDNCTSKEVEQRIKMQLSEHKRHQLADDFIENNKAIDDLKTKVYTLHQKYQQLAKSKSKE